MSTSSTGALAALKPIAKAAQYGAGALGLALVAAYTDDHITDQETVSMLLAFFGTFATYVAGADALKRLLAGVVLALEFTQLTLTTEGGFAGFNGGHVAQIVLFILIGLGVVFVPNAGAEPVSAAKRNAIEVGHTRLD